MMINTVQFNDYKFQKIINKSLVYYHCHFNHCIINETIIYESDCSVLNKYINCTFNNCIFSEIQYPERYNECWFNNNKYHDTDIENIQSILDKDKAFNALPDGGYDCI